MRFAEPFTSGIALIPRACARSWPLVEELLDLTLRSVRAQSDPDFDVVIAGHDRPESVLGDPRITFLEADWPVQEPGPGNADGGRKKRAIEDFVLARGGGLLMLLDADDWIDVRLVEAARYAVGLHQVGALIERGVLVDLQSLRAAAVPDPAVFDGEFHRLCGSSGIARLVPDEADSLRRNPCRALGSHHQWVEAAREHGAALGRLPVRGAYLINTSENHSELHGPYAEWRRRLTARANLAGAPLDDACARRFGVGLEHIRAAADSFFRWESPAAGRSG